MPLYNKQTNEKPKYSDGEENLNKGRYHSTMLLKAKNINNL